MYIERRYRESKTLTPPLSTRKWLIVDKYGSQRNNPDADLIYNSIKYVHYCFLNEPRVLYKTLEGSLYMLMGYMYSIYKKTKKFPACRMDEFPDNLDSCMSRIVVVTEEMLEAYEKGDSAEHGSLICELYYLITLFMKLLHESKKPGNWYIVDDVID